MVEVGSREENLTRHSVQDGSKKAKKQKVSREE